MDTHTADAYAVLAKLRETGDNFPTVIVSTASPYKFCDSVLEALGEDSSKPGAELIDNLSTVTGTKAPTPLTGLDSREVRFKDCMPKEKMPDVVMNFLG